MPLSDFARAIPGVVVFGLLPGLALATLLSPRWSAWLRLAAAPGLSAGLVGVLGLLAHDAHVPLRAWWVGAITLLLLVAAAARLRLGLRVAPPDTASARPDAPAQTPDATPHHRYLDRLPYAVALICGAVLVGTLAAALRDEPLPLDADPAVHAAVAERIASTGDLLPVIPIPIDHSALVRPRAGAEAVAALAASAGASSPTSALLPLALLSVLLAPLSLTLLALELTRSRAIATLAPALAAGFPYPSLPLVFGEVPLIVEGTLIIPLVLAALRALRGVDLRANLAMVAASVAAIWATHGTEVLTAAVIAVPVALLLLAQRDIPWREWLNGATLALFACAAGALLVTVITITPAIPAGVPVAAAGPTVPEATTLGGGVSLADFPRDFFDFVFPSRLWLLLYVLAVLAAVRLRSLRGLLLAHLAFAAILADVSTHRVLFSVWRRVFPWSEPDRLAADQYRVLPVLLAAGAVYAFTLLLPVLRARLPDLARRSTWIGAAAGAAIAGVAVGIGHDHDARFYASARASVGMVSPSDLTVMHEMAAQLPAGTPVTADGIDDAGQWAIALTPDPAYMSKDYVISHPQDMRTTAIAHACDDPAAARQALDGAGAIFVGARERAGAKAHWSADCVARIPGLRLLARDGNSAAFAVEP